MAWSRAACVLGGVRLISSARMMLAKTGPRMNRNDRSPVERFSSITSVPVMSDGMRSGVNWMRLNFSFSTLAMVEMSSVFARPGTPTMRQWPRENIARSNCSMTSSWPMMTLWISCRTMLRAWPSCSMTLSSSGLWVVAAKKSLLA